ncbi:hypothetical protein [Longispora albida]|uniref:hypothetical protein n=1 Tax=Longispora albida TaxID=203523 RepID=UPI0003732089|nr:hypothetical protein [Longispora albida]
MRQGRPWSYLLFGATGIPVTGGTLLALAVLLLAGAGAVLAASRGAGGAPARLGALVFALGMLARALTGIGWAAGLGFTPGAPCSWLNLLVYLPVCLATGAAALAVSRCPRWLAVTAALPAGVLLWASA